jgi:hypothetical protein
MQSLESKSGVCLSNWLQYPTTFADELLDPHGNGYFARPDTPVPIGKSFDR